jgi:putative DNA primase/helicase
LAAAILTAIQRRLLESAPLFAFDAPTQRSGKSLLAESVGIIATGRKPAATGVARQDDELRKAITSALREGQAIVNLDNITRVLDSPDLARALTQSQYADRLLGLNRMLHLPTNLMWTATGNNLTFRGDLPSRVLLCRIDAETERPEERQFKIGDLPAHLAANRKQLLTAALTILRAYHMAGRPPQDVRRWGGFDQWSREIREPLVWLGLDDPCATREQIIASDPDRESAAEVLRAWQAAFVDRMMLVRDVVAAAQDGDHDELKQALLMVTAKRDQSNHIDARRLGIWCAGKADRILDGLRLTADRKIRHAQGWRVSCVSSVSSKPAGENGETRAQHDAPTGQATESVSASLSFDGRKSNSPNSPDSQRDEVAEDGCEV